MRYRYGTHLHHRELPTPQQCRAARALTGLGYRELAQACYTCPRTLLKYLAHNQPIPPRIVEHMRQVFERHGVHFEFGYYPGVRFKSDAVGGRVRFTGSAWVADTTLHF